MRPAARRIRRIPVDDAAPEDEGDTWQDDARWQGWDGSWASDWAPGPAPGGEGAGDDELGEGVDDEGPEPRPRAPRDPDSTLLLEGFLRLVDVASERLLDRPVRPRAKVTIAGMARGEIDVVRVEAPAVLAAGLLIDRITVRAERVRVAPGLPPRLRAGPVDVTTTVAQENVDRWTSASHLPIRLALVDDGVAIDAGVAGLRVGRILTELDVTSHGLLRLRPRRATFVGLPAPLVRFLRGYLPLPPLPRGAHLAEVRHSPGEVAARFRFDELDEPMTPDVALRMARLLRIPLP